MGGTTPEYHELLSFLTIFHSLNEFNNIYPFIKEFELHVRYSLAPKLFKNHNNVVYNDSTQSQRTKWGKSTLGYEWSHGQFWPCFGKNHINQENIKKGKTSYILIQRE